MNPVNSSVATTEFTISRSGSAKASASPRANRSMSSPSNRKQIASLLAMTTVSAPPRSRQNPSTGFPSPNPHGASRAWKKPRHNHDPPPATVEPLANSRARITFDSPQRAVTPGQAAVLYDNDIVLAGSWIL